MKWKVTGMPESKPSKLQAEVRQTVSSILTVLSNESKQSFRPCKIFKAVWKSAVFVGYRPNFVLAAVCIRFASNKNVRGNSAKWLCFWQKPHSKYSWWLSLKIRFWHKKYSHLGPILSEGLGLHFPFHRCMTKIWVVRRRDESWILNFINLEKSSISENNSILSFESWDSAVTSMVPSRGFLSPI